MLDLKFIRENSDLVKEACKNKNVDVDMDRVALLDEQRRTLQGQLDELNRQRNLAAKEKNIEEGKRLKAEQTELERTFKQIDVELELLLLRIPNLPSDDTPVGKDDSQNVVLREVGEPATFAFEPRDHMALGALHDWIDNEKAAEVAGARFTYLKGDLVLLQNALLQFALSVVTSETSLSAIAKQAKLNVSSKPFVPVVPPLFIRPEVMQKMARLEPKDERYYIDSDNLYLIGSAEHTLGPLHMNETIAEDRFPLRYCAYTAAFRREAGSYGKDTKGILRLHQFDKLEMVSFSTAETSTQEQNFLVAIQEHLMQALGIPYRVVMSCTGDQGDPDARHIDIECWMPGEGKYRETHSADLMTDYQARRLNTKVKRGTGSEFVHTNDATVIAMGRTLIALIENGQQVHGSVVVPEVLRPYLGGREVL